MGDVTRLRGGGPVVGGAAAEATTGEPVTIAVLIARAFGVLGNPTVTLHGTTPAPGSTPMVPTQPGSRSTSGHPRSTARHLHVVRDDV